MLYQDSSHPLTVGFFPLFSFFKFQNTVVKKNIEKLGAPA